MKSEFILAINEITETRALSHEIVMEALRSALVSAYRRDVQASSAQKVESEIDMQTGKITILVEKEVVQQVESERTEVEYNYARTLEPNTELGDTIMVPVDTSRKFGRIAAQTAKQVILQKIREAERESLYDEYIEREGDLISGTVQSISPHGVTLSLGRTEALLPRKEQMPGERYKPHEKVRTYLLKVEKSSRGPQIIVSRAHKNMLRRLLEYEVPEIYNGQVDIKNIAREAGHRSKVAVAALQEGVDPVGACVGMRGIRIENIVRELSDEKIDVIEWNPDPALFITKALSPARVSAVFLDEEADNGKAGIGTATVVVPDDQLSLAIGREGQNARLAAKLTGWRIDIKSVTEATHEAMKDTISPHLAEFHQQNADLRAEVERILAKRESGRPIMPEEFQMLTQYVKGAEAARLETRKSLRREAQARVNAVRSRVEQGFFSMPVQQLPLPSGFINPLSQFESVGEIMTQLQLNPDRVAASLEELPEEPLKRLQTVLENLEVPEIVAVPEAEAEAESEAELAPEAEAELEVAEVAAEEGAEEAPLAAEVEADEAPPAIVEPELEVVPPAVVEPALPARTPQPEAPAPRVAAASVFSPDDFFAPTDADDSSEDDGTEPSRSKKRKSKQRRRQLVYDEDLGEVVAKRKRKSSRRRDIFDEDF